MHFRLSASRAKWLIGSAGLLVVGGLLATVRPGNAGWGPWGGEAPRGAALLPVPASGPVDVGFSQFMVLHHDQVVVLGHAVQKRASPMIAALGASSRPTSWWRSASSRAGCRCGSGPGCPPAPTWRAGWCSARTRWTQWPLANYLALCQQTPGGMPGAASMEEINGFDQLSDPRRADARFLQYMIRHHQGGMPMLVYAAQHAETLVVRQAAWRMLIDQSKEVMQMGAMLRNLGEAPLPMPVPAPDLQALVDSLKPAPMRAVQRLDQQNQLLPGAGG